MRTPAFPCRVPFGIALLSLSFWPFSGTELRAQAARDGAPSRLESTVDTRIKPGDDFFAYANGAWLEAAVTPSGRDRGDLPARSSRTHGLRVRARSPVRWPTSAPPT